jgi:hypothetical protein
MNGCGGVHIPHADLPPLADMTVGTVLPGMWGRASTGVEHQSSRATPGLGLKG